VTAGSEAVSVKVGGGGAGACTVSAMVVISVSDPDVPVMVAVTGPPVVAVPDAVSVSRLDPVEVGLGVKPAVTPLGNPDAASVTAPVNPPTSVTEIVLVPLFP
jgi:hypothetical protein